MLKKKLTEVTLICLLRGLYKRIDWDKIPRTRRPEIPREMQDSLYVLALKAGAGESAPTVDKLIELVANRFNARLQPFTFTTREGTERQTFMAYAEVPRSLLTRIEKEIGRKLLELAPAFDPESGEERQAKGTSLVARVPWMALARALDYDTVQLVIEQSAPAIVSYVTTSPQTDEDREAEIAEFEAWLEDDVADAGPKTFIARPPERSYAPEAYITLVTAVTEMAHGADQGSKGNTTYFRRVDKFDTVRGRNVQVPDGSGNALRHHLRAEGVRLQLADAGGLTKLDVPAHRINSMISGGNIDKGADTSVVFPHERRKVREICQLVDLLGGSYADTTGDNKQLYEGSLAVGAMILVCAENADVIFPDRKILGPEAAACRTREELADRLPPARYLTTFIQNTRVRDKDLEGGDDTQMIMAQEVVKKGAQWIWWLMPKAHCSALALSFLSHVVESFREHSMVFARARDGHGMVDILPFQTVRSLMAGGDPVGLPTADLYLAHVRENADALRRFLLTEKTEKGGAEGESGGGAAPGKKGGKGKKGATASAAAPAEQPDTLPTPPSPTPAQIALDQQGSLFG